MADQTHPLPAGTIIEDEGGQGAQQKTTITIPAGSPGEGTYTSANPDLADDARFAKAQAGKPGIASSITVSGTSLKKIKTTKTL